MKASRLAPCSPVLTSRVLVIVLVAALASSARSFSTHSSIYHRNPISTFHQSRSLALQAQQEQQSEVDHGRIDENDDDATLFKRSCQVDLTLTNLRKQIPLLLVKSLDKQSAASVYDKSVKLVGPNGEELASDRDELISLSTTLVTASAATRQASLFARSFAAPADTSDGKKEKKDSSMLVSSQIVLDITTLDKLQVKWETNLLGAGTTQISGLSELLLNDEGFVSQHKLLNVKIDGQQVNAVGETLATLRRALRSVQDSPLLSPLTASFPFLNEIRDELLQQSASQNPVIDELPPLYVSTVLDKSTFNATKKGNLTLIDDILSSTPLPGSSNWVNYVSCQKSVESFIEQGIPLLSKGSPKEELYDLFASSCALYGIDKTIVCEGSEPVADFYRTLATIRVGTRGNWNVKGVEKDWKTQSVIIDYVANNPVRVEGKDRYTLSKEGTSGLVGKIEQLEIVVSGTKVEDPDWFRQFYSAVKTGRSAVGAEVVMDLLNQVNGGTPNTAIVADGPAQLGEKAAASVYGILCALHRDLASLSTLQSPPAATYIAPSIELKGYLNEVLFKGESAYKAAIGVALVSFRGALGSGRVTLEKAATPKTTVIFKSDGRIRVDLILNLRLKTLPMAGQDLGIPLKLQLISDYRTNKEGTIVEHAIVETRVNDQLTPGDVVTRFLKGTAFDEGPLPVQSVLDALNWARTFAGNNGGGQKPK